MQIDEQTIKVIIGDLYLQKAALEIQVASLSALLEGTPEPSES